MNLIGDHTDYQAGLVLPMAIDRDVVIALRERSDGIVSAVSDEVGGRSEFRADRVEEAVDGWGRYLQGVAWALGEHGVAVRGLDGVVASDVPVGAGLSSSAALELAAALALVPDTAARPDRAALARAAQRAEVEWVGMSSGIMDQLASACGMAGHALLIDCRSLEVRPVPLPEEVAVLVLDTGVRRELVGSGYNTRRRETEQAASALGVATLRDAAGDAVDALEEPLRSRARHVIGENARVERCVRAVAAGDPAGAGGEMAASHISLRDDFSVVTGELDAIVAAAAEQPGCHGARMTGAGFGGCAVALVDRDAADAVAERAARRYRERVGRRARVWTCVPADGASELPAR